MNQQRLREEKEKMVETAMTELANDGTIEVNWQRCFVTRDVEGNTVGASSRQVVFQANLARNMEYYIKRN